MNSEPFLQPLSEQTPFGEELRHDPQFQALQAMIEPASRDMRRGSDGNITLSANVDWDAVISEAEDLAAKGRDLRLLVLVTRAWANRDGLQGLAAGLTLMAQVIEAYWDALYPELRSGSDPRATTLPRKNAILQLENTSHGLLGDLEMNAMMEIPVVGAVRGRELVMGGLSEFEMLNEMSQGLGDAEIEALKETHEERVQRVSGACLALVSEAPDEANALLYGLEAADAAREALQTAFNAKCHEGSGTGNGVAPEVILTLSKLQQFLQRCGATLGMAGSHGAETPAAVAPATSAPVQQRVGGAAGTSRPVAGRIESRADVEKALDQIIAFYERTEPASPIPHMVRRLRRMVPMDFIELMEEVAPSGIKEFKNVAGVDD